MKHIPLLHLTVAATSFLMFSGTVHAATGVYTQHNNLGRTGANLEETVLNTRNVNSNQFGLAFSRAVDDSIFVQPLIVPKVKIGAKGRHDLVIVATANDSLYAFDADDASASDPYWHVSFLRPNAVAPRNSDMTGACGGEYSDFTANIGIVSTPVIDPKTETIYLLARTKEDGTNFVQRLHALDLRTGAERPNSPVIITGTYPGKGDGNVGGILTFDPQKENQRMSLALVDGLVYLGWSSHCDWGPYHGWLMGYDAKTLKQTVVYNTTPDGAAGGIWMSDQAPAVDAKGNLYVCVGNGTVGTHDDPRALVNRGESFLKLTRRGNSLQVTGWFTPSNWKHLNDTDLDFGNSGPMLIPGTHLAICGDKGGKAYVVNCDNPGGLSQTNAPDNIVQSIQVSEPNHVYGIFAAPVWWHGAKGSYAYFWCKGDNLRQYRFDSTAGKFEAPEYASGQPAEVAKMPGGILAVSADGSKAGSGILWAAHTINCDGNHHLCPGILEAYDAENVSKQLWTSEQNAGRDSVGTFAKFVPPTVANGKVYLATTSNRLNVYGLVSHTP